METKHNNIEAVLGEARDTTLPNRERFMSMVETLAHSHQYHPQSKPIFSRRIVSPFAHIRIPIIPRLIRTSVRDLRTVSVLTADGVIVVAGSARKAPRQIARFCSKAW